MRKKNSSKKFFQISKKFSITGVSIHVKSIIANTRCALFQFAYFLQNLYHNLNGKNKSMLTTNNKPIKSDLKRIV